MYKDLTSIFGKHIDSQEFQAMTKKYFPKFKLGKNKDRCQDKETKIELIFNNLDKYLDVPVPTDPQAFKYFTGFFFGKDESEIPFGLSSKDDETTTIKKAGKPTKHNKKLEGSIFEKVNNLHYHIDKNFQLLVNIDPETGKNCGNILVQMQLKGMPF
jgi:hypothetical protein